MNSYDYSSRGDKYGALVFLAMEWDVFYHSGQFSAYANKNMQNIHESVDAIVRHEILDHTPTLRVELFTYVDHVRLLLSSLHSSDNEHLNLTLNHLTRPRFHRVGDKWSIQDTTLEITGSPDS